MPIFDFQCKACGHTFESVVLGAEKPVCDKCGGADLAKQVSTPAPQSKTPQLIRAARAQAAREGHFSHYKRSERPRS